MAFDPLQWAVIGIIVVVLLLWGPSKIPQLARSLGRAKKEYEDARKEYNNPTLEPRSYDILVDTARRLGIDTTGMNPQQISDEIVRRTSKS